MALSIYTDTAQTKFPGIKNKKVHSIAYMKAEIIKVLKTENSNRTSSIIFIRGMMPTDQWKVNYWGAT